MESIKDLKIYFSLSRLQPQRPRDIAIPEQYCRFFSSISDVLCHDSQCLGRLLSSLDNCALPFADKTYLRLIVFHFKQLKQYFLRENLQLLMTMPYWRSLFCGVGLLHGVCNKLTWTKPFLLSILGGSDKKRQRKPSMNNRFGKLPRIKSYCMSFK